MEEIKKLKAELKLKEKEIKRRDTLKKNAEKFCAKMNELKDNRVMWFYYNYSVKFKTDLSIDDENYYFELFEYLSNDNDVSISVKSKINPCPLQNLIDICILCNIPYNENVLKETYCKI